MEIGNTKGLTTEFRENKVGRPTILTGTVVKKLETAFKNGANITEACSYAEISRQVFYDNIRSSEEFLYKMQDALYSPKLKALKVLMKALDKGDTKVAMWLLEKRYGFANEDLQKDMDLLKHEDNAVAVLREVLREMRQMRDTEKVSTLKGGFVS